MPSLSLQSVEVAREQRFNPLRRIVLWLSEKELSRDFWIFFAAASCFDFGFAMFFFLHNLFLLDFGYAEKSLGLIAGALSIGSVAGTIPVGALARKFSVHQLLLAGFLLVPALSVLRTVLVRPPVQIGLAFLTGACLCLWTVSYSPAAANLTTDKNRTFAFSLLFSVGIGSGAIGGVIAGYLPRLIEAMDPSMHPTDAKRVVLLLASAIAALGAWPISRLLRFRSVSQQAGRLRLLNPLLLRFLPAIAVWGLVIGAFTPFANVYLSRHRISVAHIGLVFSASQLGQLVAVLMAPILFRKAGLITGIMCTQLATAIALCALASLHGVPPVVAAYLCFTAAQWMSSPGIYTLLMNMVPEGERSGASAANLFVMSLSQAISSALAGAAYGRFGYAPILPIVAGIAVAAALLFRLLLGGQPLPGNDKRLSSF